MNKTVKRFGLEMFSKVRWLTVTAFFSVIADVSAETSKAVVCDEGLTVKEVGKLEIGQKNSSQKLKLLEAARSDPRKARKWLSEKIAEDAKQIKADKGVPEDHKVTLSNFVSIVEDMALRNKQTAPTSIRRAELGEAVVLADIIVRDDFRVTVSCTTTDDELQYVLQHSAQMKSTAVLKGKSTSVADLIGPSMLAFEWISRVEIAADQEAESEVLSEETARQRKYLLTNGLAQWPWELWLNSRRGIQTPTDQLVFMRPTLGVGLSYRSQEKADATGIVGLEPIGIVRYRDTDSYTSWYGVSLLTTIGTEGGAGVGALFRWNDFSVGYVVRGSSQGDMLFVGVDLYRMWTTRADDK